MATCLNKLDGDDIMVVAVPFPAQGHINPLLCLSSLFSLSGRITVHFVGSTTHIRQAKLRANWLPGSSNFHFHEFSIPHFSTPPPNPNSCSKFPSHLQASFDACLHLRDPVASLLRDLSKKARRIAVIHDELMASVVQDAATIPNVETFFFHTTSVFTMLSYGLEFGYNVDATDDDDLEQLPKCPPLLGFSTPVFLDFMMQQAKFSEMRAGDIFNTSLAFEGHHVDLAGIKLLGGRKHWAVGPLIPLRRSCDNVVKKQDDSRRDICLTWLDQKQPKSVLFISFGTTTSLDPQQIHQLALGLESSNINFIWVLRDADKGDIFTDNISTTSSNPGLPQGYQDRVRGKGMVVSHWVPQLEILGHASVGGFMTHCGWNSCLDSISMGVPMLAWPMHSDQPANAILVTELLRVGIVARHWSKSEDIVMSSDVKEVVIKLIASDEIRRRAEQLGRQVRCGVEGEEGVSQNQLTSLIQYITR